tara:strand:+ start:346 stop:546 length:201 start_codon:yes stop_codon:yes gene_type:complete
MEVGYKGSNNLEERLEMLEKQKKFMQDKLRQAGARIKDLEEINKSHQKLVGSLMTGDKYPKWDDTE